MFCEKCGAPVSDAALFCAACGASVTQPALTVTASAQDSGPSTVPDNIRRSVLAQAVQVEVLAGGRVETQGDFNAALRFGGKPVNHIRHLLLTLVTLGLWVLVWIALAISSALSK
jgi:zinc-ribbon domain